MISMVLTEKDIDDARRLLRTVEQTEELAQLYLATVTAEERYLGVPIDTRRLTPIHEVEQAARELRRKRRPLRVRRVDPKSLPSRSDAKEESGR